LLLTLVANSCAISSQYTQVPWYETPPPGGYSNPKKPQGGFCGDIAKEWHELKTHVMSLHGDSAAVEALRHHVHALEQHVHHLEHRVNQCTCGGDDGHKPDDDKRHIVEAIGKVLKLSMMFYEAQRSGKLSTHNNRVPWRGDSGLHDVGYNGEDLTGGWYEGSHPIKSVLPMAYSVTVLATGMLIGREAYERTGQLDDMFDSIKWPLDYLLKCHIGPNQFYAQVGNYTMKNNTTFWIRPENMTTPQPAFMLNETNPGSAVAAETAAAMAAGSMIFKERDADYSATLLLHARQLYNFAYDFRGLFLPATPEPHDFKDELAWGALWLFLATEEPQYVQKAKEFLTTEVPQTFSWVDKTVGAQDELAWGALWLFLATEELQYVQKAKEFLTTEVPQTFSWVDKTVGAQLIYYKVSNDTAYRGAIESFLRNWFVGGSVPYTPGGLAYISENGSLRYAANAAFVAVVAARLDILPQEGIKFARSQLEYILGEPEGRSFMVGYGDLWPQQPRHVAA
ncbi:Endoglucanase A, partial [Lamellibrachia satsuma]